MLLSFFLFSVVLHPRGECALLSGNCYYYRCNKRKLAKTRIVKMQKKEPLSQILKRVGKDKFVIVSTVLIVAGLILVMYSYTFTDVIVTPNTTYFQESASNQTSYTFIFTQPHNVSGRVVFIMPTGKSVNYHLYKYDQVVTNTEEYTQYIPVEHGIASNSTQITFTPTYLSQGQGYALNFTSVGTGGFTVNITATFNVPYTQHASRYIGGLGLALTISGVVALAYAITRISGSAEEFNRKF